MNDITETSNAVSTIPQAGKYADPAFVPNVKLEQMLDEQALARKFDGRMHGRMNAAQNPGDWTAIAQVLVNAHHHRNLRGNVRDRLLKDCPFDTIVSQFCAAVGCVDPAVRRKEEQQIADQRFDARAIEFMKRSQWETVSDILLRAKEYGNLRRGVRDNFLRYCPEQYVSAFLEATEGFGPAPTRPKVLSKAEQERRAAENRAARHEVQPQKGGAGRQKTDAHHKGK